MLYYDHVLCLSVITADYTVSMFSGGWKMRIGLGKVLLKDPNILLLDEPTNHLDLESVEWLEAFLRNQNIPMVIVSHDREFLDQVCTKIVDAEGGICTEYQGNYSKFLGLKKGKCVDIGFVERFISHLLLTFQHFPIHCNKSTLSQHSPHGLVERGLQRPRKENQGRTTMDTQIQNKATPGREATHCTAREK